MQNLSNWERKVIFKVKTFYMETTRTLLYTATAVEVPSAPVIKLRTNRGMLKYILLSFITLGIYGIVVMSHISTEINTIASKHDYRNTTHYCLMVFLLSWLTAGIYPLVWWSNISSRIGYELSYRNLPYKFGAGHFWGWDFFGSLILVGPFIFLHQFFKAMNILCRHYNERG